MLEPSGTKETVQKEELRSAWIQILPLLTRVERRQLTHEIFRRIWHTRLLSLRHQPVPVKLGLTYSFLMLMFMLVVPLPHAAPVFVPLAIGALGCLALTFVVLADLILGILILKLKPQQPPFYFDEISQIDLMVDPEERSAALNPEINT